MISQKRHRKKTHQSKYGFFQFSSISNFMESLGIFAPEPGIMWLAF
ncbi:hypothetical protein ACT1UG_29395 [Bacillus paramycoides]